MLTKDLAICIRVVDYSETSQVVTFFARQTGKISAIAKGSKRPKSAFGGPVEMLSHGQIVFSDSSREKLATLTEFEPVYEGPGLGALQSDLFGLNCSLFAAELLNHLTDDYDPHPGLFDGFLQFLRDAEQNKDRRPMLILLISFQLTLLTEVGLQPALSQCANCKTKYEYRASTISAGRRTAEHPVYFSSSANGLICRDCEPTFPDRIKLSENAAACLTSLKQIPDAALKTLIEIQKVLLRHFTELIGRPPKMAKHVLRGD
jgi:DNA repair protein RecO (recombination protein O)